MALKLLGSSVQRDGGECSARTREEDPAPVSSPWPVNVTTSLLLIEGSNAADSGPMLAGEVPGPAIVTSAPFLARNTSRSCPGSPP